MRAREFIQEDLDESKWAKGALAAGALALGALGTGALNTQGTDWDKLATQGQQVATSTDSRGNEISISITNPNNKGEYRVTIVKGDNLAEFITKTPQEYVNMKTGTLTGKQLPT